MAAYTDFLPLVSPFVANCPEPVVKQAVLRVARDFLRKTEVWKHDQTITAVASQADYTLTPPTDGELIRVKKVTTGESELELIEGYDYTVPDGSTFRFERAPTEAGVEYTVYARWAVVRAWTTFPDDIFDEWQDAMADGIVGYLLGMANMPWSNLQGAFGRLDEFNRGINECRVKLEQDRLSGLTRAQIPSAW